MAGSVDFALSALRSRDPEALPFGGIRRLHCASRERETQDDGAW